MPDEQTPRMEPNMPSILTVPEVAGLFRVSPKTVFGWQRAGRIPSFRTPGRGIRFKRADVEAFMNAGAAR